MARQDEPRATVGSNPLRRAATVVDAVALSGSGLPLNDIASAVRLPNSTTHRIVNSLLDIGYLEADPRQKVYRVGPRIRRLFNLSFGDTTVEKLSTVILTDLANRFGEVAFVGRLVGKEIKLEAFAFPKAANFALIHPGYEFPMHATATGKAIFAFQPEPVVEELLSEGFEKYQANTIITKNTIRAELAQVRERGYAVNDVEYDPGIYAVAAPVHVQYAGVLFAICLVGMKERMVRNHSEKEIADAVIEASRKLSQVLTTGSTKGDDRSLLVAQDGPPSAGRPSA